MAKKRMFRLDVLETDAFMDMPLSTQALYFHLNMRADDDGFVGNPKMIVRNIGASVDDLNLLLAKRFVLQFEDGVIVIKHWRMHNTLSKDRYHETNFVDDKKLLLLKDNGAYSFTEGEPLNDSRKIEMSGRQSLPKPAKDIDAQKTNNRRTKDEQKTTPDIDLGLGIDIDKDLIIQRTVSQTDDNTPQKRKKSVKIPPDIEDVRAYCKERNNNIDPEAFMDFYTAKGWRIGKEPMKDWKAAVRTWERNRKGNTSTTKDRYSELDALIGGNEK